VAGLFAPEHIWAVAAVSVLIVVLITAARLKPGAWITPLASVLAIVLVVDELSWVFSAANWQISPRLVYSLPLQICDIGTFVAAFALWLRRPFLVELTYFWGVAGTFQALVTPDLPQHFPSYLYFQYYVAHGGIVAAALFLVLGLGLKPRPFASVRVAVFTLGYAAVVGILDAATGANYLYLRSKPGSPTLLDVMGPWPWYVLPATITGLVLFAILEAPFRIRALGTRRKA
jgi:hypothetical integral membrane protein (TIGR02206 family)